MRYKTQFTHKRILKMCLYEEVENETLGVQFPESLFEPTKKR